MRSLARRSSPFALAACAALAAWVVAGPLTPPAGPVTSTFKTLSDVEPRIAIRQTDLPLTITDRGSYYLAENVSFNAPTGNAISIQVGGSTRVTVSLDLNGFELRQIGTPTNSGGIRVSGDDQGGSVIIRNGFITGFTRGIDAPGYGLNVQNVGFGSNTTGVYSAGACIISNCTFHRGQYGVFIDSIQQGQTFSGGAVVSNCTAKLVTNGFYGGAGVTFTECEVYNHFGTAFEVGGSCTVRNCGSGGGSIGILASAGNLIEGNRISGAGQDHISLTGAGNRAVNNTIVGLGIAAPPGNASGFRIAGSRNTLTGNTVRSCYNGSTLNNYAITGAANQLDLVLVELPQTVSWPATLTLAGDLSGISGQNGITVAADNITIDLAGHALVGVGGSVDGIAVPAARRNLAVRNGTLRNWGNSGIWATNATGARFDGLIFQSNGQHGILTGPDNLLRDCNALSNGLAGFTTSARTTFSNCQAASNGSAGFALANECQATDCTSSNNIGAGLSAGSGCLIQRCDTTNNAREGILAVNGNHIEGCNVRNNQLDGIRVDTSCQVLNCTTNGNGTAAGAQAAIQVLGTANRIEGNNLSFEDGLNIAGTGNFIARNTLRSANVLITPGNSYGPFINVSGVNDISGTAGSNHPQANFFY